MVSVFIKDIQKSDYLLVFIQSIFGFTDAKCFANLDLLYLRRTANSKLVNDKKVATTISYVINASAIQSD